MCFTKTAVRSLERARISGNGRAAPVDNANSMDAQSIKREAEENLDDLIKIEDSEYQVVTSSSDSTSSSASSIPKVGGIKKTKVVSVTSSK